MLSYASQSKRSKGEKFNISLGEKTTNVIPFAIFIGLQIISDSDVKQQTSIFSLLKKKHRLSKIIYLIKDLEV